MSDSEKVNLRAEKNNHMRSKFLTATPLNSPNFIWPLKGNVIKRYSDNPVNRYDGISIAGSLNSAVLAAGDGKVVFVGDSGRYGKLVIIKHENKIFTAYAHNSRIIVRKGDFVKKGDIISRVGKSGAVDIPQLYFSIKNNKVTVNPESTE